MRRRLRFDVPFVAGVLMIVALAALANAGGTVEPTPSPFRVTWERRPFGVAGTLEGRVENESPFRVNAVRLRVEGLDEAGNAVGETSGWVFGSIPARGQGHFVVRSIPRATNYRITVTSFQRIAREEPQQSP